MSVKRWLLVGLLAVIVFAAVVAAQDDDDDTQDNVDGSGKVIEEVTEGVDAEDAAGDIADTADEESDGTNQFGLRASHYFTTYADLKVPAGERVEVVVPIVNALNNPTYEVVLVSGQIMLLDFSRSIQNFSAQLYQRTVEAGETVSVKYSVTPDALLDPMEYAFVVAAYVRNRDDNQTISVTAFNGTMVVLDPLGFDFKGTFSTIALLAAVAGGVYYFYTVRAANRPAPRRVARAAEVETGTTKKGVYDPEFVDKSHLAYVEKATGSRNRSASK